MLELNLINDHPRHWNKLRAGSTLAKYFRMFQTTVECAHTQELGL